MIYYRVDIGHFVQDSISKMLLYLSLSTAGRLPRRPGSLPARVPPPQDAAPDARHRQRESQVRSRGRALDFCLNVVPGDRIGPFQICGDEDCRKRAENAQVARGVAVLLGKKSWIFAEVRR